LITSDYIEGQNFSFTNEKLVKFAKSVIYIGEIYQDFMAVVISSS